MSRSRARFDHDPRFRLARIARDCGVPNWDGTGAAPIRREALVDAKRFLHLASTHPEPSEIVPSHVGFIEIRWRASDRREVAVRIAGDRSALVILVIGSAESRGRFELTERLTSLLLEMIDAVLRSTRVRASSPAT